MKPILFLLTVSCTVVAHLFVFVFGADERIHQLAEQTQRRLTALHSAEPEADRIKKCEIILSDEGFLRHRRTYATGKQEYYSLNLSRLRSVDYYGTTKAGSLTLHTQEDDVIVQTYNDRSGNVDSMSVRFDLSLRIVEPEDISALERDLIELKRLLSQ